MTLIFHVKRSVTRQWPGAFVTYIDPVSSEIDSIMATLCMTALYVSSGVVYN